jgi:flagellar biosynthetic protein FliR
MRISALMAVFPIFSTHNFPIQMRLALGGLGAYLVAPSVAPPSVLPLTLWGLLGLMLVEVGIGLLLGFITRLVFYALDFAGNVIAAEMGLMFSPDMDPFSESHSFAPGMMLYFLAAMLMLSLDLHHWLLVGFQRSYALVPMGGAHLPEALLADVIGRTGDIFVIALQIAAPIIAVSFIITLMFSVLGRAVPQMNVFAESFPVRTLVGLTILGMSLNLMSQHIVNHLRRIPNDFLRVAQLLGSG